MRAGRGLARGLRHQRLVREPDPLRGHAALARVAVQRAAPERGRTGNGKGRSTEKARMEGIVIVGVRAPRWGRAVIVTAGVRAPRWARAVIVIVGVRAP